MTHIATPAPASTPSMKTTTPMVIFAGRLGHSRSSGGAMSAGIARYSLTCEPFGSWCSWRGALVLCGFDHGTACPAGQSRVNYRWQETHSLDHLVGGREERFRHLDAERPGRLLVDDQLELDRLLDRQVGGLGALENLQLGMEVQGWPPFNPVLLKNVDDVKA
jgi:hypothetical protein